MPVDSEISPGMRRRVRGGQGCGGSVSQTDNNWVVTQRVVELREEQDLTRNNIILTVKKYTYIYIFYAILLQ